VTIKKNKPEPRAIGGGARGRGVRPVLVSNAHFRERAGSFEDALQEVRSSPGAARAFATILRVLERA
jgi:hypothetical protein